ncbi:MAG: NAD(P)H-dependent oxidoreductase [Neomegalonema sp.]|nr:NAD(P)H-dependent oxidoreductase [Neomegalonema sp.]
MKILAFGASSSRNSINKKMAAFAASLIDGAQVDLIDLNDFELPLYSQDKEAELGQPHAAAEFLRKIQSADGLVVSFAEHNGSYTAAYKNLFDWASRIEQKVFQNKPAVFLSTSPGAGGAASVLSAAKGSAKFFGVDLRDAVSVPKFYEVFDEATQKVSDPSILEQLKLAVAKLAAH